MHDGNTSDFSDQTSPARRPLELAAVVAASLVSSLIFCNKAFHIDDTLYLSIARQIRADPLRPFSGEINWQQVTERSWGVSISPPGMSYWLAGWMALGVTEEIGLHTAGSFWVVLLAVATYFWARRLGAWPLCSTLLVVTGPLVVAGQNLMLDVPMVALGVSSITLYLHAHDRQSTWKSLAAGLLAGLSVNVKYAAIVVVGVMVLDVLLTRRWRMLAAPAVAIGLLVAGQWASAEIYGTPQLVWARQWITLLFPSGAMDAAHRGSLSVVYLGASGAWLVWLGGAMFRRSSGRWWVALAALLGVAGAVADFRRVQSEAVTGSMVAALACTAVFAFNGWAMLCWIATRLFPALWAVRSRQWLRAWCERGVSAGHRNAAILIAWTVGFWYLGELNGPFVAPRGILPCLVGLVLAVTALGEPATPQRLARWGAVVLTTVMGGAVGFGDYCWANSYRAWASRLAAQYRPTNGRMVFVGHWGWQYYAEAAGMVPYDFSRIRLEPGDVVVFPVTVDRQSLAPSVLPRLQQIGSEREYLARWIPRTRNTEAYISFYGDTLRGRIPWGWPKGDVLEEFLILRYGD